MITIKGGVTVLPNSDNKDFIKKLKDVGVKVKLPFEATGFKSTKVPDVDTSKIQFETEPTKKVKKKVKSMAWRKSKA